MILPVSGLIIWLSIYPLALYLMVDSGTDFTFRRPQALLSLHEKRWLDYEGNVFWLLLARFLTGCFLIASPELRIQVALLLFLLLLEILAGRIYLPKMKR